MNCAYFPKCKACTNWDISYENQKLSKVSTLNKLLFSHEINYSNDIIFLSSGSYGLRHKTDFAISYDAINKNYKYGYYGDSGEVIDIKRCLQFTDELQNVFEIFQSVGLPASLEIRKASVRIRVGPSSEKGLWIDCANSDIKKLLDEKNFLKELNSKGFIIEIGQKKKHLDFFDEKIKMTVPKLNPWFKTWDSHGHEYFLNSYVSSFTQPGWLSGKLLVNEVRNSFKDFRPARIVEFGAGIGFFSRILKENCDNLTILEIDSFSLEPLKFNLRDVLDSIDIQIKDFHNHSLNTRHDLAFVNPARSGLKNFADNLLNLLPEKIIYISCYPESMIKDLKKLSQKYNLRYISIVDQFPQTNHYEVYCELTRLR